MQVNLSKQVSKGGRVNLSKDFAGITRFLVGLGWDVNKYDGDSYDLDLMAFILGANGKVLSEQHFVFYGSAIRDGQGRACDPEQSLIHTGDNRTGEGEGDDEQMILDLGRISPMAQRIVFAAVIYDEHNRGYNFGQISNAFIRMLDANNQRELLRSDLSERYSSEKALIFCEIYKHDNDWKYNAVLQGYNNGLPRMCAEYGVSADYNGNQPSQQYNSYNPQMNNMNGMQSNNQYGGVPNNQNNQYGGVPNNQNNQYGGTPNNQNNQFGTQPSMIFNQNNSRF